MSFLPDEMWARILELGTSSAQLNYRDLCSVSITCRRLHRLSAYPALWSILLSLDFPNPSSSSSSSSSDLSSKSLYQLRFERDRRRKQLEWRRKVALQQNEVNIYKRRMKGLETQILDEGKRLRAAVTELESLERARRASVALNVWQPDVVHGRHKQIVENCTVPVESRLSSLNMEIRLCKQQISIYNKSYNDEKRKLEEGKEILKSMNYNPLHSYQPGATPNDDTAKHKKLKVKRSSESVKHALIESTVKEMKADLNQL